MLEGVTNPDRITIPEAWDGLYVVLFATGLWATNTNNYAEIKIYRNVALPGVISEDKLVGVTQVDPAVSFNTMPRADTNPGPSRRVTSSSRRSGLQPARRSSHTSGSILFGAYVQN